MQKEKLIQHLRALGFKNSTIRAFAKVNREIFVPNGQKPFAYEDTALPIGYGQTISQPRTIAFMLDLLDVRPGQKILEVGSGSGYVLALLNEITKGGSIYGAEIVPELRERSRQILANQKNIHIQYQPQALGLPSQAPFQRILVSAAAAKLPAKLFDQLDDNGLLVCPVQHSIIKAWKEEGKTKTKEYYGYVFVPLIE